MNFLTFRPERGSTIRVILAASMVTLTVVVGSAFFFVRSRSIMELEIRQKLQSIASVGAQQFDANQLKSLQGEASLHTPEMKDIVERLQHIRNSAPGIRYAYIMRRTKDPMTLEFVADADSLSTPEELDLNHNGVVDDDEQASYPGELYDASAVPMLQGEAFQNAGVDFEVTKDKWGESISGYAPIRDSRGLPVAVLGLDMNAQEYFELSQSIFSPVAYLLILAGALLLGGYLMLYAWQRRMDALKELEGERYTFMNIALHQLGAPLATFRWWLEILKENEAYKDDEICKEMDKGITGMNDVLDNLTHANRVWKGDIKYVPVPVSIQTFLEDQAKSFLKKTQEKQQKIEITIDPSVPSTVSLDPARMSEVCQEVIDNAVSYSPEKANITIRVAVVKKMLTITVEDHGCGIPKEDQKTLFQTFMRGANAVTMKPVGNGLGLFMAQGIMKKAGGYMGIESTEGKGTTVTLYLPLLTEKH